MRAPDQGWMVQQLGHSGTGAERPQCPHRDGRRWGHLPTAAHAASWQHQLTASGLPRLCFQLVSGSESEGRCWSKPRKALSSCGGRGAGARQAAVGVGGRQETERTGPSNERSSMPWWVCMPLACAVPASGMRRACLKTGPPCTLVYRPGLRNTNACAHNSPAGSPPWRAPWR